MAFRVTTINGIPIYVSGAFTLYIGHRHLEYVRDFVNAAIRKVASAFVEALDSIARNRGVIVRPIYPKYDLGLPSIDWSFSIGSTSTDERNPVVLVSKQVPDRAVIGVYGVRILDVNPIIQHIGYRRGTHVSPMVDVTERDEHGYLFFRSIPIWKPKDVMEILVTAKSTGTLNMAILGFVAEVVGETADWVEG